ncbi:hypothetical protein GCM10010172_18820 [Paractinoplanes ferrugineus]|uniref:Uncharacterized protein n=1 Tax=Paractinoplanes ferrugineus TaxID=113564 RepID=A0A919JAW3_9ACTN|nr:hypothetical protein Afe05nite_85340 [Actinoplanes ferrugineus]
MLQMDREATAAVIDKDLVDTPDFVIRENQWIQFEAVQPDSRSNASGSEEACH